MVLSTVFFFNDTATTEIYTLSLHDALPIYPRQVAMYLARELTDSSLPKIGNEFGGRDHTTVIHAKSKIARMIREDRSVYNLDRKSTRLNSSHANNSYAVFCLKKTKITLIHA